ncbi:hypothetical protein BH11MYX2_BH11MYX2_29400 [soil metagenome]
MIRSAFVLALFGLVACGGGGLTSVKLVNNTPRPIETIQIDPAGQPHTGSRAKLAPNATTTVQLKKGNYEIYAIGEKIVHDDKTRETPEASLTIELREALDVIFYDSNDPPANLNAPTTRGIMFRVAPEPKKDDGGNESPDAPSAEAPAPTE